MSAQDPYKNIASVYDRLIGERDESAFLLDTIEQCHPQAESVLELACGTGKLLELFSNNYSISGIDISKEMLQVAKKRLERASLSQQDITHFQLEQKFDVILCLFNSLNHISSFQDWKRVFRRSKKHLKKGGIFVFDINTERALENYSKEPPRIEQKGADTYTTEFSALPRNGIEMHVRVFRQLRGKSYQLHETKIKEKTFPTEKVLENLKGIFSEVRVIDPERNRPSKASEILYFVCYT